MSFDAPSPLMPASFAPVFSSVTNPSDMVPSSLLVSLWTFVM